MPLNAAGHYWKSVIPTHTNKVFYEIPIECNGDKDNFPEQNDYKKRRSSNVENMDVNSFSQFSSPSTSVMSSQKEPLFKKNQSRVSHVNGGEPCNQTSGFESFLSPTSIPTHTQSLSPKKKARVRTFLPRETTQSKKKFIKLQDKVKENHKNISNAKKQRAHMNPVRNAQSPDHTSTKSKDLKQPTFLKGSSNKIQQCEVPKARLKKPSVKIQQLTESCKSPKRMPKTRSNAISVGHRSTENAKTKSIVSSSVQNDSCTIKMKPMNKQTSKKKLKEVAKPTSLKKLKKNEVSDQKKRTPKKYKRINTVESSDESDMEISIKNKLKPKKLKPIDSETESDEVNTQMCIKENPVVHEVEPVLPAVITLSIQEPTNMFSSLKELDSSESISSNEDSEKKSDPVPNDDSEKISHPVPNEDSEKTSHPVPNEDSERISHPVPNEDSEKISHPVPSVIIVNEVPSKEKSACNPMKQTKNPYKNLVQVPFQDNQPAFFTNILQQVKGMNEITNFCIPSTSRVESNEVVDLDAPPVDEIIIDLVSSDEHEEEEEEDDDVEFIEVTKAKG